MERIAVDMDGVLADIYNHLIKMHFEESGEILSMQNMIGQPESNVFPHGMKHITTSGFFRNMPIIPGSREVLEAMNREYDVFIVSAATQFPHSLSEKLFWLQEHFPFLSWEQIVFCGNKDIIHADVMIDDYIRNLDQFNGETILFTQPHNMLWDIGRHKRVHSWREIGEMFLE